MGSIPKNHFRSYLGEAATRALARYPRNTRDRDIVNDVCIRCQAAGVARRFAQRNGSHVHFYVYDFPQDNAFHGAELDALWQTNSSGVAPPANVVELVQRIWTRFAARRSLGEEWLEVQAN